MKKYLKMIKPWDYIIISCLILISFLPLILFSAHQSSLKQNSDNTELTAIVSHNGKELYRIKLTGHKGTDTYTYKDEDGDFNVIKTTGEAIRISDANCSDQVCVRRGAIKKSGDTIVCLPHKLLIEIKADTGVKTGGMVTE